MNILMCEPTHYNIYYKINPWMNPNNSAHTELSMKQWHDLCGVLRAIGVNLTFIKPESGLPDMVFTANAGLVYKNKIWLSNFRHPERKSERKQFEVMFSRLGFDIANPSHLNGQEPFFEGAGDALFAGNTLIGGYGFRSDPVIYQQPFFRQFELLLCELVNPYFYHLDTCFCPLSKDMAMWYPGAFSQEAQYRLRERFELIDVDTEEAKHFACNAIIVDKHIVLPAGCPTLVDKLQYHGFHAHECNMSEFIKSGGACKCLTLTLFSHSTQRDIMPQKRRSPALEEEELSSFA